MKRLFASVCVLLASGFICAAQPIQALRFEGLWKLNGPNQNKLDFQVNGETITATYYHPYPSALSDVQIEGDRFSAWYLDEFASKVVLIGQLEGSALKLIVEPPGGRAPVTFSGSRIAPEQSGGTPHRFSGSLNKSGNATNGEFTVFGHSIVFSGAKDGNCFSGSFGADGKGASMSGCLSVSNHTP
jgi:hypothetical protein